MITAAPGGGGTPPPLEGGTETMPIQERQNGTDYNKPVEGGGGTPTTTRWWGWRKLAHHSQKGVEGHLLTSRWRRGSSTWW